MIGVYRVLSTGALLGATLCALVPLSGCVSRLPAGNDAQAGAPSAETLRAFLGGEAETRFDALPLSARLPETPWASSYWPDSLGGIARRWQESEVSKAVYFAPLTPDAARRATPEVLARLSPAEKLDILAGRYDFPTLFAVRKKARFLVPDWAGICDGVALASTTFPEPDAVTLQNPEGLSVPFGSSDVKALLSRAAEAQGEEHIRMLGNRCDAFEPQRRIGPCADVSPAEFHVALAHRIAVERKPLMADVTWDAMVWNHALFGFETKVLSRGEASEFAFEGPLVDTAARVKDVVRVRTRVLGNNFKVKEHWRKGEAQDRETSETWFYLLALDSEGRIVGGEWESYERPDFLWYSAVSPRIDDPALARLVEQGAVSASWPSPPP